MRFIALMKVLFIVILSSLSAAAMPLENVQPSDSFEVFSPVQSPSLTSTKALAEENNSAQRSLSSLFALCAGFMVLFSIISQQRQDFSRLRMTNRPRQGNHIIYPPANIRNRASAL